MASSKIILKCPYCHWMFHAKPSGHVHCAFSFEKPQAGSYHGYVIKQELVCQNPKCKKPIIIYWYAPID
jgi:hypothetical protein